MSSNHPLAKSKSSCPIVILLLATGLGFYVEAICEGGSPLPLEESRIRTFCGDVMGIAFDGSSKNNLVELVKSPIQYMEISRCTRTAQALLLTV